MSKKSFIDSVRVAKPCSEDWEKMHGSDRIRFCDHCAKDVKNISAVTRKEAIRMVRASDGNICIRYHIDPRTNRPIFVNSLINITRCSPGIAASVMSASLALSTAAYAQDSSPSVPPAVPVVERSAEPTPAPTPENTTSVPTATGITVEPERMMMGAVAMTYEVRYENALTKAVQDEDVDQVRELIANGANVNGREKSKVTPLFLAVENGSVEIAKLLLDFGAKVNVRDNEKRTPIMSIDEDATPELIDLLILSGAKLDLVDKGGNTALILAADNTKPEVLQRLVDAGADVNIANKEGQTALMNAADHNSLESVRILLLAGAKVNARNSDGQSAWDLATEDEVEQLLVSYGAEAKDTAADDPAIGEKPDDDN